MLTGDVTVDDGAPEQWKQISYCAPRHGDAFCRKFVKRKGVGQNAIPSQNEAKLILLLSVVIVLLLTIPVSSSKKKEVNRLGFTSFCVD